MNTTLYYPVDNSNDYINYTVSIDNILMQI